MEALEMIPLSVPEIRGNEWKYIKECLDTNWVSSAGAFVNRFEQMVAGYVGVKHAIATVNGTAALHISLLVAGVEPDDEVVVSAVTFIAPANAVRYVGAWPVFMDADPRYWQMDVEKVKEFFERECHWQRGCLYNRTTSRRVRAILPVHILGHPCEINPLMEIAHRYNLAVIEDATEALGASYLFATGEAQPGARSCWRPVGSSGDLACFSFNGNKIVTCGGGGVIVTDNPVWAERARYLSTQAKDDPVEHIHGEIGYNYRLTNIQAAMGVAQLERLPVFVDIKRRIAEVYRGVLTGIPGLTPMPGAPWAKSTYWLYTILVDAAEFGIDSRTLLRILAESGIETRPLWQPLHSSRPHRDAQAYRIEVADQLFRDGLSLPCSVSMGADAQARVVDALLAAPARRALR